MPEICVLNLMLNITNWIKKLQFHIYTEHPPGLFLEHKTCSHTTETHWAFKILITQYICTHLYNAHLNLHILSISSIICLKIYGFSKFLWNKEKHIKKTLILYKFIQHSTKTNMKDKHNYTKNTIPQRCIHITITTSIQSQKCKHYISQQTHHLLHTHSHCFKQSAWHK